MCLTSLDLLFHAQARAAACRIPLRFGLSKCALSTPDGFCGGRPGVYPAPVGEADLFALLATTHLPCALYPAADKQLTSNHLTSGTDML